MTLTALGSVARVPTAHAVRDLGMLCTHWAHRFQVEQSGERGTVRIPRDARGADWPGEGLVLLHAGAVDLEIRIEASCRDQLEAIQAAVARHLARFSGGDMPLAIDWR